LVLDSMVRPACRSRIGTSRAALRRWLQAQRLPPSPRGLACRVKHRRLAGREGQPLPVLGTGAAEWCPPPQQIDEVGPEHVSVAFAIIMAQVNDLAMVALLEINADVVPVHDRDNGELMMPNAVVGIIRVGKTFLNPAPPVELMLLQSAERQGE